MKSLLRVDREFSTAILFLLPLLLTIIAFIAIPVAGTP